MSTMPPLPSSPPEPEKAHNPLDRAERGRAWINKGASKAPRRAANTPPPADVSPPGKKRRQKAVDAKNPWEEIPVSAGRCQVNFRCPEELMRELKWFSETTFGYDMTRICVEGVRMKLDQMRKEREIK